MKGLARADQNMQNMKNFRAATLILLIPLLVLMTIADMVDQDSFVLLNQQIIAPQDDISPQHERHHPSPVIHSRLSSGMTALPVYSSFTDSRKSTTHFSPTLLFFLRAPPLS
jgi:hypothetical protein